MSLAPLKVSNHLAKAPQTSPLYPKIIKNKRGEEVVLGDPKASRALLALMNQHAVNGGAACHWGGPSAFAEIMSALHGIMFTQEDWYNHFHFINDAGHTENGIYALRANLKFDALSFDDLKGFRSLDSKLTGHGEAHVNPEGVLISNGPLGSGPAQAQGLAMADALLKNKRITICTISDGGCMEGEAKEAFTAIPGLAEKKKINPFLLIISDNNTKLSGRISDDSFSLSPTFTSLETLGWHVLKEENGNHLETVYQRLEEAIELLKTSSKPVCLHFKTVKGQGIKETVQSASGGHGFPLRPHDEKLTAFIQEIYEQNAPQEFRDWAKLLQEKTPRPTLSSSVTYEKVQVGFSKAAIELAQEGLPIFSLSSDLQGSTGIAGFHKAFPENYIDLGVAESNMISSAIGLSKAGLIPIVDTFAQFGITKGNLPLIMSSLSEASLIALFSHTGFQDAADGASHQATTYMGAVSGIPNTLVINCASSSDAYHYFKHACHEIKKAKENDENPPSVIFFFGRENHPREYNEKLSYEWKKPQVLVNGKDGLLVTAGPLVSHAYKAIEELNKKDIFPTLVNSPFANCPDIPFFKNLLSENKNKLLTVEDHQKIGGMGQMLIAELINEGIKIDAKILGVQGKFGRSAYQADDLYALHEIDSQAQIKAFEKLHHL